jgi:general secretion pathway protein K
VNHPSSFFARHTYLRQARGNTIIAALLVVAFVATIGTKLLMTQETWVAQLQARQGLDGSREAVLASLHWARSTLADDGKTSQTDHAGEAWAQPMPVISQGEMSISGRIEDEQGKFDLNSVVLEGKLNAPALATFSRLLSSVNLPSSLAGALVDWVDSDEETAAEGGAESDYYSSRTPAYRAPNVLLGSLEELLYVRGFDALTIQTLRPFVTVLPTPSAINVNTASPEILSAAVSGLSLDTARKIVAARRAKHFATLADFEHHLNESEREGIQNLGVQSQFFVAQGEVKTESVQGTRSEQSVYRVSTLLQRQEGKWPLVIWQRPD